VLCVLCYNPATGCYMRINIDYQKAPELFENRLKPVSRCLSCDKMVCDEDNITVACSSTLLIYAVLHFCLLKIRDTIHCMWLAITLQTENSIHGFNYSLKGHILGSWAGQSLSNWVVSLQTQTANILLYCNSLAPFQTQVTSSSILAYSKSYYWSDYLVVQRWFT